MPSKLRIVVCGYLVRAPLGGLAWHHLQYVLGLSLLGHDVLFVEDSEDWESCYDPDTHLMGTDPSSGLRFTGAAFDRLGLGPRWAYFDEHTDTWLGPAGADVHDFARQADVLLNVSAVNPPRDWWEPIPVRVLIDTDPAFTQLRHLAEQSVRDAAATHTSFFTFAENHGLATARIPDDGFPWRPTRQPVVVDAWPVTPGPENGPWTTVMQWDSYPEREHDGVLYGMKGRSFADYQDLPSRRAADRFELALGSAIAPRAELAEAGWTILDPIAVTRDPWTYQAFMTRSKGEFSVAKHGYVTGGSGWFSERSANYLACGRPVVVQDTGFSRWLPTGEGLFAFTNVNEAMVALDEVNRDYERHCKAAQRLVADHFDHRTVHNALLDEALAR
jgi:hypothetical protein